MALEKGDFTFEIVESFGVLSTSPSGWNKEANMVSWRDAKPRFDLREWSPDHQHCSKGITMNEEETEKLYRILNERLGN